MTATFSVEFKDAERDQIKIWLDYLKSLDFVQAVKEKDEIRTSLSIGIDFFRKQCVLTIDFLAEKLWIVPKK